jgi:hypothetical protein
MAAPVRVSFVDTLGSHADGFSRARWLPWADAVMPPRKDDVVELESADTGDVVSGITVVYVSWENGGKSAHVRVDSR